MSYEYIALFLAHRISRVRVCLNSELIIPYNVNSAEFPYTVLKTH